MKINSKSSKEQIARQILTAWQNDKKYKDSNSFPQKWALFERMRASEQWPAPTEKTKNMPRPVFNIIDQIISHKVSAVMNENIKMVFNYMEGDTEEFQSDYERDFANDFTKQAESTWEEIKQDKINEEVLDTAANLCVGIAHYYMDTQASGGTKLKWQNKMDGEVLDPMNVGFGNPQCTSVQKQPIIVIRKREEVEDLKAEAKAYGATAEELDAIRGDKDTKDNQYDKAQVESENSDMANSYIVYWKERVEVSKTRQVPSEQMDANTGEPVMIPQEYTETETHIFWAKAVEGVLIIPPIDLKIKRYPIAIMPWFKRKDCIYGRGDTEGIIPNQRAINQLLAQQLNATQLFGFPKMWYKKDMIDPSKLNNDPGELIEDSSAQGTPANVGYLTPAPLTPLVDSLTERFIQYTKDLKGANESLTGEMSSGNLNATAIMLLQKASAVPLEGIKRRFFDFVEDVGLIWEEFWKKHYVTARLVNYKDEDNKPYTDIFRGSDASDIEFKLKIDIGPSSQYSEAFVMSALDNFLAAGYITFEEYLKYAPKNQVPFKEQLLKDREKQKSEQMQFIQNKLYSQMNPAEREIYDKATPEQQMQIMQNMMNELKTNAAMGATPQGAEGNPQPGGNMSQKGMPEGRQRPSVQQAQNMKVV